MKTSKFFKNETQYTEFVNKNTGDLWAFGDVVENINESTPHIYVTNVSSISEYNEGEEIELPITDGHGQREYVKGYVFSTEISDSEGTQVENAIKIWEENN